MAGIWEVALPGVVYAEPDRVQIIITSPADIPVLRKFSDQSLNVCFFLARLLMFAGMVTSSGSLEKHSALGFLSEEREGSNK